MSSSESEKSSQEVREEHNESFNYDTPEKEPELWSSEEYTEFYDRLIRRRTEWYCQFYSTSPFSTLRKARSHVENQHTDRLLEKYAKPTIDNNE